MTTRTLFASPLSRLMRKPTLALTFLLLLLSPLLVAADPTFGLDRFDPNAPLISEEQGPIGLDRVDFILGNGEGSDNYRLALQWDWFTYTTPKGGWTIDASLSPNYSVFNGAERENGTHARLRDIGLTPIFTFIPERVGNRHLSPFVEMGIGLHYLTEKNVGYKSFSTNFQFGDHIGVGAYFGKHQAYKLAYVFQHLSNAGIEAPNPGINFHLVTFGFRMGRR
ncbi:acyloxyacyl hydrolase [Acanthopleuribacter pedis]|uniref:Acyloxyacyl hydrolase n=1 Tax=Acanthopleuribacter pedis TaxID=442870 RepID=A0A8J7Q605_9BACT|nr:acyloxyacyl hydrolase [Acanthopleuribacter pedis]MBO1318777.1 acyloxyacyl hydrolase [Acanthopleuribacter pedis]